MTARKRAGTASLLGVLFVSILQSAIVSAQVTTADLVGSVVDPSGAAVASGTVSVTNTGTNVTAKSALTGGGEFTFTLLQIGTYRVSIAAPGFRSYVTQVALAAGDRARISAQLSLGQAEQTVTVEAITPALKTDDSSIGTLISSELTQDLPLNGRNVTDLVTLAAGVTGGLSNALASGSRPDDRRMSSSFAANGQSDAINNNMIDGMDNNERFIGSVGVRPSIDAIDQVKVLTNLYTAEISRSGGGVVDLITKSGTNSFHGTVYEFVRNDAFDAKDYFAPHGRIPKLRQNQFGGSVGGPIIRNKAFFFFDIEEFRLVKGVTSTQTVPTLYEEQHPGDFTDLGANCTNVSAAVNTNSIGYHYFKLFPAPTSTPAIPGGCKPPLNNFSAAFGQTQTAKTYDSKVDYKFTSKDSIYARYNHNGIDSYIPGQLPTVNGVNPGGGQYGAAGSNGFAGPAGDSEHSAALGYTRVLSTSLLMDLRAQFFRLNNLSGTVNQGHALATAFGFPCNSTSCVNLPGDSTSSGLPSVTFSSDGYASMGDASYVPLLDQNNTFQYVGSISWLKGSHNIKSGASLIRRQGSVGQSSRPRGTMEFHGNLTGNDLGDLLLDYAGRVERGYTLVTAAFRGWEMGIYAQDDWRIGSNLTLNLGVRYDIYTPWTAKNNGFSNFNPTLGLLYGPSLPGAQMSNATGGIATDYGNLAPRLGFAYTARPGLVVRGGYGLTYYPTNQDSGSYMRNAPFSFSWTCGNPAFTPAACTGPYVASDGSGFLMDGGMPVPSSNIALATDPANYKGTTISATDFNYKNAYLQQYSLNVQKDFAGNVITVAYVGNKGSRLPTDSINFNQPAYHGAPYPYPNLPPFTLAFRKSDLRSEYNALQGTVERRMKNGLAANVNFTWAHNLTNAEVMDEGQPTGNCIGQCLVDNGHGQGVVNNSYFQYDYGNADLDTRKRFALTMSYDIPFGKTLTGPAAIAVKGWSMNAIYYAQSGNPLTIQNSSGALSGIGLGNDRPNVVPSTNSGFKKSIHQWWDLSRFQPQASGLLGNERRDQFYGPGTQAFGLSIFKVFPIWESVNLQFRAEGFNVLNTPTFSNPGTTLGSNAGVISSTPGSASPRQLQLAAKLIF